MSGQCGYCTFAQPPARLDAPFLTPDEVLKIARQGARRGCHEALFTLGERPELRYPQAPAWLREHGYDTTVDYLAAMCRAGARRDRAAPHANAGALHPRRAGAAPAVSPSQGMMIESLHHDLDCPLATRPTRCRPAVWRRSRLPANWQIPFTTGILVGIGETESDRIEALEAIADSHRRHGHVQEVIVQNFLPKAGTAMWKHEPCRPTTPTCGPSPWPG